MCCIRTILKCSYSRPCSSSRTATIHATLVVSHLPDQLNHFRQPLQPSSNSSVWIWCCRPTKTLGQPVLRMLPRSSHCSTRNISAIPCQMHPSSHTSAVWTLCAPLCRSAIPGRTHHWAKEHCTRTGISSIKVCARAGRSTSSRFARICACVVTLRHSAASCLLDLENLFSRCIRQLRRRWCIASCPVEGPASTTTLLYHFHFLPSKFLHPASQGCHWRASLSWPWQGTSHSCQSLEHSQADHRVAMAVATIKSCTNTRIGHLVGVVHLGKSIEQATRSCFRREPVDPTVCGFGEDEDPVELHFVPIGQRQAGQQLGTLRGGLYPYFFQGCIGNGACTNADTKSWQSFVLRPNWLKGL